MAPVQCARSVDVCEVSYGQRRKLSCRQVRGISGVMPDVRTPFHQSGHLAVEAHDRLFRKDVLRQRHRKCRDNACDLFGLEQPPDTVEVWGQGEAAVHDVPPARQAVAAQSGILGIPYFTPVHMKRQDDSVRDHLLILLSRQGAPQAQVAWLARSKWRSLRPSPQGRPRSKWRRQARRVRCPPCQLAPILHIPYQRRHRRNDPHTMQPEFCIRQA